jgi:hypothetical protein
MPHIGMAKCPTQGPCLAGSNPLSPLGAETSLEGLETSAVHHMKGPAEESQNYGLTGLERIPIAIRFAIGSGCCLCVQGLRQPPVSCKLLKRLTLGLWHGRSRRTPNERHVLGVPNGRFGCTHARKAALSQTKLSIFSGTLVQPLGDFSGARLQQFQPCVISFQDRFHPRIAIAAPRFPTPIQPQIPLLEMSLRLLVTL